MFKKRLLVCGALGVLFIGSAVNTFAEGTDSETQDPLGNLTYRLIGPYAGGRVSRVQVSSVTP